MTVEFHKLPAHFTAGIPLSLGQVHAVQEGIIARNSSDVTRSKKPDFAAYRQIQTTHKIPVGLFARWSAYIRLDAKSPHCGGLNITDAPATTTGSLVVLAPTELPQYIEKIAVRGNLPIPQSDGIIPELRTCITTTADGSALRVAHYMPRSALRCCGLTNSSLIDIPVATDTNAPVPLYWTGTDVVADPVALALCPREGYYQVAFVTGGRRTDLTGTRLTLDQFATTHCIPKAVPAHTADDLAWDPFVPKSFEEFFHIAATAVHTLDQHRAVLSRQPGTKAEVLDNLRDYCADITALFVVADQTGTVDTDILAAIARSDTGTDAAKQFPMVERFRAAIMGLRTLAHDSEHDDFWRLAHGKHRFMPTPARFVRG